MESRKKGGEGEKNRENKSESGILARVGEEEEQGQEGAEKAQV